MVNNFKKGFDAREWEILLTSLDRFLRSFFSLHFRSQQSIFSPLVQRDSSRLNACIHDERVKYLDLTSNKLSLSRYTGSKGHEVRRYRHARISFSISRTFRLATSERSTDKDSMMKKVSGVNMMTTLVFFFDCQSSWSSNDVWLHAAKRHQNRHNGRLSFPSYAGSPILVQWICCFELSSKRAKRVLINWTYTPNAKQNIHDRDDGMIMKKQGIEERQDCVLSKDAFMQRMSNLLAAFALPSSLDDYIMTSAELLSDTCPMWATSIRRARETVER